MQQPMDDASFQQDQNMIGSDPNAMGGDPNAMAEDPNAMGGGPNAMGSDPNAMAEDPNAMGGDPNAMGMDQNAMGGEESDDTASIINQLNDTDKEAVRSYAKSMLNKDGGQQGNENGDGQQTMMESVVFTKKQLNKIQENFGPSQDELMKKNDRKELPKKVSETGNSPFNSPFA